MPYYVYILASRPRGTLYTGVTNDLLRRVHEHRNDLVPGFTSRYGVKQLVWFDSTESAYEAISVEKRIKNWKRQWKIELVEQQNPHWHDLYPGLG